MAACAAAWCSLHCALTPFLVVAAPALALSEGVERTMWAGNVLLGAVMLGLGPARRNAAVLLTFIAGSALWGGSLAGWFEPLPETVTSVAGGLVLAGALVQSAPCLPGQRVLGMRRRRVRGSGRLTKKRLPQCNETPASARRSAACS